MKVIYKDNAGVVIELTRRNLTILLEKLDDPDSQRTIWSKGTGVSVRAVEDIEHYADREPGQMLVDGKVL